MHFSQVLEITVPAKPLVIPAPDHNRRVWGALLELANLVHTAIQQDHSDKVAEAINSAIREIKQRLGVAPVKSTSPFIDIEEASILSGKAERTIRNLLNARDPLLLAARLPGKGYRFNRERFIKWVESRPSYGRLPKVKKARRACK